MANQIKKDFLEELSKRFGKLRKIENSQSLFEIVGTDIRIYIRYSKLHFGKRLFFGLRAEDLANLEGHPSTICFLWDNQTQPLFVDFSEYEEIFHSTTPANDGQYKLQIFLEEDGAELYIARVGRFNIEANFGWHIVEGIVGSKSLSSSLPDLSHCQIQTLLGAIGSSKGYDIWIPQNDRNRLDWSLTRTFICRESFPIGFEELVQVMQEVDVIWIRKGSNLLTALFEVEHSTPIYSGLLRFNDILLLNPRFKPRFSIVSNDNRRSLFVRQLNRPTFKSSGLVETCTFLEYANVYWWYNNIAVRQEGK